jgi:hypothetical protein
MAMHKPRPYDVEWIQAYMQTKEMGPEGLFGVDSHTYGWPDRPDDYAPDLFTIMPTPEQDIFSDWFVETFMDKFLASKCVRKPSKETGEVEYKQASLLRITHIITCTVAAVPPIVAPLALSYVSSFRLKLMVVVIFTFMLAICLTAFTKATRAEVFAVTAA